MQHNLSPKQYETVLAETDLNNNYLVSRHGKAKANADGIILSHFENGIQQEWSLVLEGEQEVFVAAQAARKKYDNLLNDPSKIVIRHSPFSRTTKTGQIIQGVFGGEAIPIEPARPIRERNFGSLEKKSRDEYKKVWRLDEKNKYHIRFGVEALQDVIRRVVDFILECEEQYDGQTIVLCSHGDVIAVTEAAFRGISPKQHRNIPTWQTAEIRYMNDLQGKGLVEQQKLPDNIPQAI